MAFRPEQNLTCPVCLDIFQDPVLLQCCHSFCRACLQPCRTETTMQCPLCKRSFPQSDPPQNLALKNLCEAFLQERAQRKKTAGLALCGLHSEHLRLFCLDHQKPVCVVCLHSETHQNHSMKPIDEAARDYRAGLQRLLKPLQEKHKLLTDIKANCDLRAQDLEDQAADTERQIKDVFSMLRDVLQKEEQARITALREEKQQKSGVVMRKSETLSREIAALSDTIGVTEDDLRAEDIPFLLNYNTTAERVQHFLPDVEESTAGARIDVNKHLNNLAFAVLNKMKDKIASTFSSDTFDQRGGQSRRSSGVELTESETRKLGCELPQSPPLTAASILLNQSLLSAAATNTANRTSGPGPGRASDLGRNKVTTPPTAAPPPGASRGLTSTCENPQAPSASAGNAPNTASARGLPSRYDKVPTYSTAASSAVNLYVNVAHTGSSTGRDLTYENLPAPSAALSSAAAAYRARKVLGKDEKRN